MEILESYYLNPDGAASFSSPDKLYRVINANHKHISRKDITEWLKQHEAYTLHKPTRRKFPRNRVVVDGIDYQWDVDTMDMVSYQTDNDGYKYVLIAIDIFSRYLWTHPLKSKHASEIIKALTFIWKGERKPKHLRSDKGSEFVNSSVRKFLKGKKVNHFVTQNETKANYAERVIKTIKSKISRYFTHKQTHKWIDVLSSFTNSYNRTYHRTIKLSPEKISKTNEAQVWFEQYHKHNKHEKYKHANTKLHRNKYTFSINDYVRISYLRGIFDREYDQKWTGEIFIVKSRRKRDGLDVYSLVDFRGDDIVGSFYKQELQKVTTDPTGVFKIEKILKRRKHKGRDQFLVRWLFWPSKYDSWVEASALKDV